MCNRLTLSDFEQTLENATAEQLVVLSNYIESKLGENMTTETQETPEVPVEAEAAVEVAAESEAPTEEMPETVEAPAEDEAVEAAPEAADAETDYKAEAERLQVEMELMQAKHNEAIAALSAEKETLLSAHSSEMDSMTATITAYKARVLKDHASALTASVIEAASEFVDVGAASADEMDADTLLKMLNFAEKAGALGAHSASAGAEETERKTAPKGDGKPLLQNDFGWLTAYHKNKQEKN